MQPASASWHLAASKHRPSALAMAASAIEETRWLAWRRNAIRRRKRSWLRNGSEIINLAEAS